MAARSGDDTLQALIDRLAAGDLSAKDRLIEHSVQRLERLTRKMLCERPHVRDLHETGDVLHNALLRLDRALKVVPVTSVAGFMGLAATQVRRELIDLARHHYGPEGDAANLEGDAKGLDEEGKIVPKVDLVKDSTKGPVTRYLLKEFHEQVARLPDKEREVVDLLFYQGLTQEEAARVLGVEVRTVRRRWREARLLLYEATQIDAPESDPAD